MKKLLTFYILILFPLLSKGQEKTYVFSLDIDDKVEEFIPFYRLESIIDARKDTTFLGYKSTALPNDFDQKMNFKKPFLEEMKNALSRITSNKANKNLLLRINDLSVRESVYLKVQIAYVSISFIERVNNDLYELFTANEIVFSDRKPLDRRQTYKDLIIKSLEKSIVVFKDRLKANKLKPFKIELESIKQTRIVKTPNPDSLKKGIYYSYYDFRDNTPDTVFHLKPVYKLNNNEFNSLTAKLSSKDETIWAFNDGIHTYIKGNGNLYNKLHFQDSSLIYLDSEHTPNSSALARIIVGSMIGGATGAIIAYNSFDNTEHRTYTDSNNDCYSFDINSGIKKPYKKGIKINNETQLIYFFNDNNYNHPEIIKYTINEKDTFSLRIQECALYYFNKKQALDICAQSNSKDKQCIQYNSDSINIISTKTKKGKIEKIDIINDEYLANQKIKSIDHSYQLTKILKE